MGAMATITQVAFRVRNDDGDEDGATWFAAINTDVTLEVGTNYRIRHLINLDGLGLEFNDQWQYNLNGGGWNNITAASSVIRAGPSGHVTDNTATTEQMGGAGSFAAGAVTADGLCPANLLAPPIDIEDELIFQIRAGDVEDEDTIQIRSTNAGTQLDTYTNTVTITVNEGGAAARLSTLTLLGAG